MFSGTTPCGPDACPVPHSLRSHYMPSHQWSWKDEPWPHSSQVPPERPYQGRKQLRTVENVCKRTDRADAAMDPVHQKGGFSSQPADPLSAQQPSQVPFSLSDFVRATETAECRGSKRGFGGARPGSDPGSCSYALRDLTFQSCFCTSKTEPAAATWPGTVRMAKMTGAPVTGRGGGTSSCY